LPAVIASMIPSAAVGTPGDDFVARKVDLSLIRPASAQPLDPQPLVVPGRSDRYGARMNLLQRGCLWLYLLTASVVVIGVFVQAFSIAAYARGAGSDALDVHTSVGFLVHSIEIVVLLLALVAFWGAWRIVGFAALLPVVGTLQLFLIGDTDESGSWVNGLHGLFALVVLLLALALVWIGVRSLGRRAAPASV
jgi:hypothetical protein